MTDHAIDPMLAPVAPPGRVCATCRWWGRPGETHNWARCEMLPDKLGLFDKLLWTPPDFGCNQWQAKGDEG